MGASRALSSSTGHRRHDLMLLRRKLQRSPPTREGNATGYSPVVRLGSQQALYCGILRCQKATFASLPTCFELVRLHWAQITMSNARQSLADMQKPDQRESRADAPSRRAGTNLNVRGYLASAGLTSATRSCLNLPARAKRLTQLRNRWTLNAHSPSLKATRYIGCATSTEVVPLEIDNPFGSAGHAARDQNGR